MLSTKRESVPEGFRGRKKTGTRLLGCHSQVHTGTYVEKRKNVGAGVHSVFSGFIERDGYMHSTFRKWNRQVELDRKMREREQQRLQRAAAARSKVCKTTAVKTINRLYCMASRTQSNRRSSLCKYVLRSMQEGEYPKTLENGIKHFHGTLIQNVNILPWQYYRRSHSRYLLHAFLGPVPYSC